MEDFVKPYKAPGQTDLQAARAREDLLNAPPEKTPLPDYARLPQGGMLTAKAAQYLHAAVLTGLNIIVIGPTGVGKTTMLRALGKLIPRGNRVLIIEDTPEIILNPNSERPYNVINLRTRPKTVGQGLDPITQNELVILALRQRPDALTLGEARGEEILSLLTALNTGHKNGLTSIHTEKPDELFRRIVTMLSQNEKARNMSEYTAASLVGKTLNIVVALEIYGRTRRVSSIFEFNGKISGSGHNAEPEMQEMFISYGGGAASSLTGPVNTSVFAEKFIRLGIDKNIFSPE
jgi:pilus assembly protein CpaF